MAHGGRRTAAITGDEPMIQMGLIETLEVFVRKPARDPSVRLSFLALSQKKEWQSSSYVAGWRGEDEYIQVYDSFMSYDMHPLLGLYK